MKRLISALVVIAVLAFAGNAYAPVGVAFPKVRCSDGWCFAVKWAEEGWAFGGTGASAPAYIDTAGVGTFSALNVSSMCLTSGMVLAYNTTTDALYCSTAGAGDMVQATWDVEFDSDDDGNIDLAAGGTDATLTDPDADRIYFWDDGAGATDWLIAGDNLTITGTTLDAASGGFSVAGTNLTGTGSTVSVIDNPSFASTTTMSGAVNMSAVCTTDDWLVRWNTGGDLDCVVSPAGGAGLWARANAALWPTYAGDTLGSANTTVGVAYLGSTYFYNGDVHTDRWLKSTTNVFIGHDVLGANTLAHGAGVEGWHNVAIGEDALYYLTTGANNTGVGSEVMERLQSGSSNTAFGKDALYFTDTGSYNTAVGMDALQANTDGEYNIAIGYSTGSLQSAGDYNVIIGANTEATSSTGSKQLNITGVIKSDDWSVGLSLIGAVSMPDICSTDDYLVRWNTGGDLDCVVGGTSNSFETMDVENGTDPVAGASDDTLTIYDGTGIDVTGDATADSLTIATVAGEIDHDSLSNWFATHHFLQSDITETGTIATGVWAATAITGLRIDESTVDHNALNNYFSTRHFLQSEIAETGTIASGTWQATAVTGLYIDESTVDHDSLDNFESGEHFTQASITTTGIITAGTWNATAITGLYIDESTVDHDSLDNFESGEHFTQASITTTGIITAGTWNATAITGLYIDESTVDHDTLKNYFSTQHFLQSEITETGVLTTDVEISNADPQLTFTDTTGGDDDWRQYPVGDAFYIDQNVGDAAWTTRLYFDATGKMWLNEPVEIVANTGEDASLVLDTTDADQHARIIFGEADGGKWYVQNDGDDGDNFEVSASDGLEDLIIAQTGVATFSTSVSVGHDLTVGNDLTVTDAVTMSGVCGTDDWMLRWNTGGTVDCVAQAGGGDMSKSTYDIDEDGDIDLAAGGLEADMSDPNDHRVVGWDDDSNTIVYMDLGSGLAYNFTTDTLSSTGGGANSFETWNVENGTDPVADVSNDTILIYDGPHIEITGSAVADSVTFAVVVDEAFQLNDQNITETGNITPNDADTDSVGASGNEYAYVWANALGDGDGAVDITGAVAVDGTYITVTDAAPQIRLTDETAGDEDYQISADGDVLYFSNMDVEGGTQVNVISLTISDINALQTLDMSDNAIVATGNITPNDPDTDSVGASDNEYGTVWANTWDDNDGTVDIAANLGITGAITSGTWSANAVTGLYIDEATMDLDSMGGTLGTDQAEAAFMLASEMTAYSASGLAAHEGSGSIHFHQDTITETSTITAGTWNATAITGLYIDESTVDHDALDNFESTEHFTQANITATGTIASGTWAATAITGLRIDESTVDHNALNNYFSTRHFLQGDITETGTISTGVWAATAITGLRIDETTVDHNTLNNYFSTRHFLQSEITATGVIASGTWNATAITDLYIDATTIDADDLKSTATTAGWVLHTDAAGAVYWAVDDGGTSLWSDQTTYIEPADGTDDLGASGDRMADIYANDVDLDGSLTATGGITVGSNIVSDTPDTDSIGASDNEFATLWVNTLDDNDGQIDVAAVMKVTDGDIYISHTGPGFYFEDTTAGDDDWTFIKATGDGFRFRQYVDDTTWTSRLEVDGSGNWDFQDGTLTVGNNILTDTADTDSIGASDTEFLRIWVTEIDDNDGTVTVAAALDADSLTLDTALPVAEGGTSGTTAATARAALEADPPDKSWTITGDDLKVEEYPLWRPSINITITDIFCITDTGTVTLGLEEGSSTSFSGGTAVDANITCDSDGAEDDGSLTNGTIDATDWLALDISATASSPTILGISINYTID